jgi:hypothetical protein
MPVVDRRGWNCPNQHIANNVAEISGRERKHHDSFRGHRHRISIEVVGSLRDVGAFLHQLAEVICDPAPDANAGPIVRALQLLDRSLHNVLGSAPIPSTTGARVHQGGIIFSEAHCCGHWPTLRLIFAAQLSAVQTFCIARCLTAGSLRRRLRDGNRTLTKL